MSHTIPLREVRFTDRSRTVLDWKCKRARYWGYEYNGRGIVFDSLGIELFLGTTLHDAIAAIATQQLLGVVDIDGIAGVSADQVRQVLEGSTPQHLHEQAALVEGLIRGFYRVVWPTLLAAYPTIVAIEEEMPLKVEEWLIYMTRPDLVMQDSEGGLHYPEWKSTSWKKESWINQWGTAVQLHSTMRAIEANLGVLPEDVQIVGLYKGYEAYGKQTSPFCYGFKRNGNPPFSKDEMSYIYKPGFHRTPTWEMPGGVKAWVEGMPVELLSEQFPRTAPIFIKDDLINAFFRQLTMREAEIKLAMEMLAWGGNDEANRRNVLDVTFPQSWDQCVPAIGHPCDFRKLCHGQIDDPLQHGFSPRSYNHPQEGVEVLEGEVM